MTDMTWRELGTKWNKAIVKLLMLLPQAILEDGNKPKKNQHKDTIIQIIPFLIFVLSAASITNLSHRAYSHHSGWSSYLVGAGLAALVPVAVFVAIKIEGWQYKTGVWLIASVFAAMSAMIQYQVYIPTNPTADQILEAVAFGGGVPLAECLLAAMEAFLLSQLDTHVKADEQAQQEKELKSKQAETQAEFERRKQEIDLQNYAAKLAQEAELKRLEMQAKLDAERMKLEAKLQSKSVEKSTKQVVEKSTPPTGEDVEFNSKKAKIQQRRNMIFQHIKINGDPGPSAFAEQFGVDRGTIYTDLKALVGEGAIYKNGDGGYHAKN